MARNTTTKTPAIETVTPATEAPVETPATEAATETPAPLTITQARVGTILLDALAVDATVTAYGEATPGDKTKIRNAVTAGMRDSIKAMDLVAAQAWSALSDAIAAAGTKTPEKVDANRVVADRALALMYAAHRLIMGDTVPDGIEADDVNTDTVQAMIDEWRAQADPDAVTNEVAEAGRKIARTKITRSTVRGSVEAHIETAFDGLPSGTTLTVAQIRTRSGAASDGAIAARVWPVDAKTKTAKTSTLDFVALGVTPCEINGVRGLRKN
jgi:hypothetical protein